LYRYRVIAAYCSNFGHFAFSATLWGLGITYDVHRGLIGKHVVDFLLELIELCSLGNRRFRSNAVSLIQNFR